MTCIVVIGPPRSGTSAVAGVLHNLGVPMYQGELGISGKNSKGYFEDSAFNRFHHYVIDKKLKEPVVVPLSQQYRNEYERLVASRVGQPLWGVKDPRLCFAFPLLHQYVGDDMKMILTHRERDSVVRSMADFWTLGYEQAGEIADKYLKARSALYFDAPFLWVNYDALLNNTEAQVKRLAEFAGARENVNAIRFIDGSLRHY